MKQIFKSIILLMIVGMFLAECDNPLTAPEQSQPARELSPSLSAATEITENCTAWEKRGYFYSFWSNTPGASMKLFGQGRYTAECTSGNMVCGLGSAVGEINRKVTYRADEFEVSGGGNFGLLCLYGWSTNPAEARGRNAHSMIEYYVVDNYHGNSFTPGTDGVFEDLGTITADGGTYDLYKTERKDRPWVVDSDPNSEDDRGTFWQYWSVRQSKRTRGTITLVNHVNGWISNRLYVGHFGEYYQIMATEGFGSTVKSDVTIEEWTTSSYRNRTSPRMRVARRP